MIQILKVFGRGDDHSNMLIRVLEKMGVMHEIEGVGVTRYTLRSISQEDTLLELVTKLSEKKINLLKGNFEVPVILFSDGSFLLRPGKEELLKKIKELGQKPLQL